MDRPSHTATATYSCICVRYFLVSFDISFHNRIQFLSSHILYIFHIVYIYFIYCDWLQGSNISYFVAGFDIILY